MDAWVDEEHHIGSLVVEAQDQLEPLDWFEQVIT